jgi:hypothetical protein
MKTKDIFFLSFLAVASIILVAITFSIFPAFSGFAAGLAKAVIGIVIFYAIDKVVLKEVDTLHELINKQNTSYALFILSYSIILAACIATA